MKITREEVMRVAELAHLELSEAEIETYRAQLDSILAYMEKLNQLAISGVEPMAQVLFPPFGSEALPLRDDDEVKNCEVAEAVLDGAPDACKPYFRVPKVIER